MSMYRKAYSVIGALLMLQVFLQLYFIAGAIFHHRQLQRQREGRLCSLQEC